MRNKLLLSGLLIPLGVFVSAPALAAGGCIDVSISASPATVCAGQTTMISASIVNCGETRDRVMASITVSGPGFGFQFDATSRISAGQNEEKAVPMTIPVGSTPGMWTVAVDAVSLKGGADASTAHVEVISCQ